VLAVGTRFVDAAGLPVDCGEASLFLVNADDADLVDPRTPDVAVHGDARLALEALLEEVPAPRCPDTWADLPGESRRSARVRLREVEPQRQILEALRTSLPDDALVVSDLTQVGYAAEIAYPVFAPRSYLTPGYQGTLGYAFATALGAKVANPHRPVVSLSGDGGFGWTLPELATAGQHGIAVTAVVFTDGAFGNVRRIQQEQFGGRYIASDLAGPDLRHVARAYDVGYHHAGSPAELGRAVRTAVASNVPAVVEMPVGELPTPWPLLREHLDGPGPSL
jgi:acetolactate synthase-1/2/3 large subunit